MHQSWGCVPEIKDGEELKSLYSMCDAVFKQSRAAITTTAAAMSSTLAKLIAKPAGQIPLALVARLKQMQAKCPVAQEKPK